MSDTDYRNMSDEQLDTAIAEANITPEDAPEAHVTTPEPEPEDGLHPSSPEDEITIDDFKEPLESYEVDNLHYALAESSAGVDVLVALDKNEGVVSEGIIELALTAGVSPRQIEGFKSQQMHTANKVFADNGLSFVEGRDLMKRVNHEFSATEMQIFKNLANENINDAMQSVKLYFATEDR